MTCAFCDILDGEVPGKIIFENDSTAVIVPKKEVAPGHLLVIPKKHYENLSDIPANIWSDVALVSQTTAQEAISGGAEGVNLLHATGEAAQQSVFHFHVHMVPRRKGDGLDLWLREGVEDSKNHAE